MQTEIKAGSPEKTYFALPANLGFRSAEQLKNDLLPLVESANEITVNAAEASRMSTAAIQVLAAFVLARRAHGRGIRFEAPSENFVSAFEILGLRSIIEDGVVS